MVQADKMPEGVTREPPAESPSPRPEPAEPTNLAVDWELAHAQLLRLARRRAGLELDEGKWLLAAFRSGAHVRLGYGSFAEYIERVFGYAPRFTHDKLRVAEALEILSVMPRALRDGGLSWSAVRELTRVATPRTEGEWVAAARGRTTREVERLVAGHRPGSRPQDPAEADARRHVLRFEVSGDTLAAFRDAAARIRRDAGSGIDDDAVLLQMARHVLGGQADTGRSSYQVAISVCEQCKRARVHSHGDLIDADAATLAMAQCDAQHLPPSASHRAAAPASGIGDLPNEGGERRHGSASRRAHQDVPPATRRLVLERDGRRCCVPGCRHRTFLDVHHLVPRADGGSHVPDNLITLCGAHHRAVHTGSLVVEGSWSSGLRFTHGDGRPYGHHHEEHRELPTDDAGEDAEPSREPLGVASPRSSPWASASSSTESRGSKRAPDPIRLRSTTLRALRRLGFGERESHAALRQALTHVGSEPSLERLIRAALSALVGDHARAS